MNTFFSQASRYQLSEVSTVFPTWLLIITVCCCCKLLNTVNNVPGFSFTPGKGQKLALFSVSITADGADKYLPSHLTGE